MFLKKLVYSFEWYWHYLIFLSFTTHISYFNILYWCIFYIWTPIYSIFTKCTQIVHFTLGMILKNVKKNYNMQVLFRTINHVHKLLRLGLHRHTDKRTRVYKTKCDYCDVLHWTDRKSFYRKIQRTSFNV